MPTFDKVTSDVNETVFGTLLEGYRRLTIPLFQRQYTWGAKEYEKFSEDVKAVSGADAQTRFIGACVAVERGYGPNFPTEYEIVDGQQRLCTIYISLCAASFVLALKGESTAAALLLRRYAFLPDFDGQPSNTKLSTSIADAAEFRHLWDKLLSVESLRTALAAGLPRPPAAASNAKPSGNLTKQFDRAQRFFESEWKDSGRPGVDALVTAMTSNLSFVWLSLQDPGSAPSIFESLNNRGVKTTVGDLVRNEVFSHLREKPNDAQAVYNGEWTTFVQELGAENYEAFFFPYGLLINRSTKKSELFTALRSQWKSKSGADDIIREMRRYVPAFLAFSKGQPPHTVGPATSTRVRRYKLLNLPTALAPFVMAVVDAASTGALVDEQAAAILDRVESFLVRRALCGKEPTGLHAVFKGLWPEIKGDPSVARFEAAIRNRKTVDWPNDAEFCAGIKTYKLYRASVEKFVLTEYDRSLGGDVPSDFPETEHILPQKLTKDWSKVFTPSEHEELRHTWANLIPISSPLNKDVSYGPYAEKRKAYADDSMFKTPREVAHVFDEWTPGALRMRADLLVHFALTRWP